jgi:hypothetical protein
MSCHFLLAARSTVRPWVRCSFAVKREQVPPLLDMYIACGHVVTCKNLNNYRSSEPLSKITYLVHRNSADETTERKKTLIFRLYAWQSLPKTCLFWDVSLHGVGENGGKRIRWNVDTLPLAYTALTFKNRASYI